MHFQGAVTTDEHHCALVGSYLPDRAEWLFQYYFPFFFINLMNISFQMVEPTREHVVNGVILKKNTSCPPDYLDVSL